MTDETKQGETPETPVEPKELESKSSPAPSAEKEEEFDKERAMNTIHSLREQEKQWKKDKKELENFKAEDAKRKEAEMSDLEKAQKKAAQLEADLKAERLQNLKLKVAGKYQLPESLANRLQGETEDELDADAKALAELLPKQQKAAKLPVTDPAEPEKGETDQQRRTRLSRQGGNFWDADMMKQKGGGAFISSKEKS